MSSENRLWAAFTLSLWQRQAKIRHRDMKNYLTQVPLEAREDVRLLEEGLAPVVLGEQPGLPGESFRLPKIPERWKRFCHWNVCYFDDPDYPQLLRNISDPPALLYYEGEGRGEKLSHPHQFTIVGSRRMSSYGKQVLRDLIPELCLQGYRTVSGFALGVDGLVHELTLLHGGETLAVMPCSLDITYPSQHQALRERLTRRGFMISEYPPETGVRKYHFAARNRLLSGLSPLTLVIEAGEQSGSLITANQALDQGRDVMAVPGSIFAPGSGGCNRLISEGALVYLSSQSLLAFPRDPIPEPLTGTDRDAEAEATRVDAAEAARGTDGNPVTTLEGDRAILRLLAQGAMTLQELKFQLPDEDPRRLYRALILAELRGEVEREHGRWSLTKGLTL